MSAIILSIKPEYVERIFIGEKLVEYRKWKVDLSKIDKIVVYASSPVQRIVGEFEIENILALPPKELWLATHKIGGISADKFTKYFNNTGIAYAFKICNLNLYPKNIPLAELGISNAPQKFQYLSYENYSKLLKLSSCDNT